MKKCDHFRELILLDYIDGVSDKDLGQGVEAHLLDCSECRVFFKEVKNIAVLPFQRASRQPVPAELWGTIKQRIEHENQAGNNPLADFIDNLKGLFAFPRLVPIFATFIVMFLAGSVTLSTIQTQQAKEKDQGEYLIALLSPTGSSAAADNNDGETPIEHYFL